MDGEIGNEIERTEEMVEIVEKSSKPSLIPFETPTTTLFATLFACDTFFDTAHDITRLS